MRGEQRIELVGHAESGLGELHVHKSARILNVERVELNCAVVMDSSRKEGQRSVSLRAAEFVCLDGPGFDRAFLPLRSVIGKLSRQ